MDYWSYIILLLSSFSLSASDMLRKHRLNEVEPRLGGSVTSFTIQRISDTQGLYLIGETHNYDYTCQIGNLFVMEELCKVLREADEDPDNNDQFYVLVESRVYEQDYFVYDFLDGGGSSLTCTGNRFLTSQKYTEEDEKLGVVSVPGVIHYGLVPLHHEKPFRQTVVEDCEIRKISGAAIWILSTFLKDGNVKKMREREGLQEWFRLDHDCGLFEVTFTDVIDEFDRLYAKIEEFRDAWNDTLIKKEFEKDLNKAKKNFALYRLNILEPESVKTVECRAKENEAIFDYCERLGKKYKRGFKNLKDAIKDSFTPLFDAHILNKILQLREEKRVTKIIFLGGESHTRTTYMYFSSAEERDAINRELNDDKITPDVIAEVADPLDEVEAKRKSWCVLC